MNCYTKTISLLLLGFVVVINTFGCSSNLPYVSSKIGQITLIPSPFHQFTNITAYEEDGETVLYGDMWHEHSFCENSVHIDLASIDSRGNIIYTESLALRNPSMRQRGWFGAQFRTRIPTASLGNGSIHLAFHDTGCHKSMQFACEENQAEARAKGTEEQR